MKSTLVRRYRETLENMGLSPEVSEEARSAATAIRARDVNSMLKGAKVVPVPEDGLVLFSAEHFLAKAPASPEILARSIEVLKLGAHEFFRGASPAAVLKVEKRRRKRGCQIRPKR